MLFVIPVRLFDPIDGDDFAHGIPVDSTSWVEALAEVRETLDHDWIVEPPHTVGPGDPGDVRPPTQP